MIRSRDLVLFFVSVFFLLLFVLGVAPQDSNNVKDNDFYTVNRGDNNKEYKAELYQPKKVSREERLSEMRNKVVTEINTENSLSNEIAGIYNRKSEALYNLNSGSDREDNNENDEQLTAEINQEVEQEGEIVENDSLENNKAIQPTSTDEVADEIGVNKVFRPILCTNYKKVTFQTKLTLNISQAGDKVLYDNNNQFLTTLPSNPSYVGEVCLPSDVIGIAKDGSLIRNNEVSLYKIFSSDTLIGYALDGWPIYGLSSGINSGSCGESKIAGGYVYYLSDDRETVLNCFISTPVKF